MTIVSGTIWASLGVVDRTGNGTCFVSYPWPLHCMLCFVATKLLQPLVKRWRPKGLGCTVYIDNGIRFCVSKSQEQCVEDLQVMVDDLELGFIVNMALIPQQIGQWLEFILDLLEGR